MPTNLQKLNLYEFVTSKIFESCPSGIKWGLASISRSWGQAAHPSILPYLPCEFLFRGNCLGAHGGPTGMGQASASLPCGLLALRSVLSPLAVSSLTSLRLDRNDEYSQVFSSPMLCCHKRSVGKNIPSQQSSLKFRVKGSMSVQLRQG